MGNESKNPTYPFGAAIVLIVVIVGFLGMGVYAVGQNMGKRAEEAREKAMNIAKIGG